jgi:hypothetical protein
MLKSRFSPRFVYDFYQEAVKPKYRAGNESLVIGLACEGCSRSRSAIGRKPLVKRKPQRHTPGQSTSAANSLVDNTFDFPHNRLKISHADAL